MKRHVILFFLLFLVSARICSAQDSARPGGAEPVRLTEKEWKSLEGYFTFVTNPTMKVQFTASGEFLYGKLLWNNGDIHLFPSSPLTFVSKELEEGEPLRVTFHRDPSGEVNELVVGTKDIWKREKNYKPEVKKEIPHTPEMLKPYEGLYQEINRPGFFMRIREQNNQLVTKMLWNDGGLTYFPISDSGFYSPVAPNFTLDFQRDKTGKIVRMLSFKSDVWVRKEPPHFTDAEINVIAGDYVSKDDPDNSIRLSGKGNHLTITQLWDKKQIELDAIADNYFYNEKQSFPLLLVKNDQGKVTGVVLLTTDEFIRK